MEFKIKHMDKNLYKKMKNSIKNSSDGDYFGALVVGGLSFDFVSYCGEDEKVMIYGDCYVLYENTGYGYTQKGNIPYSFMDEYCVKLPLPNCTFEEWKEKVIDLISEMVINNEFLKEKANIEEACWD